MSRAYLLVICLLAASFTGCLADDLDDNEKPLAKIENKKDFYEITCERSAWAQDDTLKLSGTGYDSDGIVWGYEWKSSIDGVIGTEHNITISGLSTGNHTISFSVKDDKGKWSDSSNTKVNAKNYLCGTYSGSARDEGGGNWSANYDGKVNPSLPLGDIIWNIIDTDGELVASGNVSKLTNESEGVSRVCGDSAEPCSSDVFTASPYTKFWLEPGVGILSEHDDISNYEFYLTYKPTGEALGYPMKFLR